MGEYNRSDGIGIPSVLKYLKFYGKIYYLRRPLNLALKIQIGLRKLGAQKSIPDILIASI
jgi:hypothetical protein